MSIPIRKATITAFGDPSVVKIEDSILPPSPKDNVQVKILYSGFAGSDINMRLGVYPFQKSAPLTPGYSLIGTVHANGPNSTRFAPGATVACLSVYDAQSTLANLPEAYLIPVPTGLDPRVVPALVLDWATAYGMVERATRVTRGQRVFVHGLSGAVGSALLRLCLRAGATVYGTASARNHDALKALGCVPFAYSDKEWIASMRRLGGVDAVFDPLGFESWDESWSVLRKGGILVGYGGNLQTLSGGPTRSVIWPTIKLLARNLVSWWTGKSTSFYYISRDDKTFKEDVETLFGLALQREIEVPIKGVFELDEVPIIHRDWTKLEGMGSVVVKIG